VNLIANSEQVPTIEVPKAVSGRGIAVSSLRVRRMAPVGNKYRGAIVPADRMSTMRAGIET
jgi:hypothetical protein